MCLWEKAKINVTFLIQGYGPGNGTGIQIFGSILMYGKYIHNFKNPLKTGDITCMCKHCVPGLSSRSGGRGLGKRLGSVQLEEMKEKAEDWAGKTEWMSKNKSL